MLQLHPQEQVLLVMRRHWFVLFGPAVTFGILLILPSLVLSVGSTYLPLLRAPGVVPYVNFFLAIYLMAVLTYMLLVWLDYYLDAWIITDQRVVDIEQRRLFDRRISEIAMERIQNVTIEIPGFIATMLNFGNIKIETAGEQGFTISEVPHCDQARELIRAHSRQKHGL